jgi:hypothetical protein
LVQESHRCDGFIYIDKEKELNISKYSDTRFSDSKYIYDEYQNRYALPYPEPEISFLPS